MSALVVMSNKPYWLAAPDVTEALSQALKSKPAFSLRVIQASADPNRSAEVICRIDTPFGTTKESADEEAGKYFSALDNVTEESLNGTRVMCREWVSTHLNDWKNLR
ncbi:MAG: hypothetical protein JO102_03605 [Elusimicrobia bacterium]|nr:hypothetical protein [Elusimicrobiota bacterium]